MLRRAIGVVGLLSFGAFASRTGADPFADLPFGVSVTSNIVYATGAVQSPAPGEINLLLDLYEPDGAGVPSLKPGFVLVHGGGFTSGSKTNASMVNLGNEYASRGYVAVSINYRLTSDDPPTDGSTPVGRALAAAIEDTANAIRWMRDNAAALGISPDHIVVGGYSAGAITSLFVGYTELGSDVEVQAVLSLSGGLYGFEAIIDPDDPPLFAVHGTADTTVPYSLAVDLENAAIAAPIVHEFYSLEGVAHNTPGQMNSWIVDGVTLATKLSNFLYTQLDLATIAGHLGLVHVDFAFEDLETGSDSRPCSTLGKALSLVAPAGTIRVAGDSSITTTSETFTGPFVIDQSAVIQANPAGPSGIRIGVTSGSREPNPSGFISRR